MSNANLKLPTPNWNLFDTIMRTMKIVDPNGKELMNPYQVCKNVFEMTFFHYSIKFYEEKYAREKVEGKIIGKNVEIGKLQQEVKELKERLDDKADTTKS